VRVDFMMALSFLIWLQCWTYSVSRNVPCVGPAAGFSPQG
jgi:hypothetical protein